MRAADVLTLTRLPLALALWLVEGPWSVFVLLLLAAASDVADGMVARRVDADVGKANQSGPRAGAWLDPLCDKTFVVSLLLLLMLRFGTPFWWLLLVATRELLLLLLGALHLLARRLGHARAIDYTAAWPGKLATVLQFLAVVACLFQLPGALWLALGTSLAGVGTGFVYGRRMLLSARTRDPVHAPRDPVHAPRDPAATSRSDRSAE